MQNLIEPPTIRMTVRTRATDTIPARSAASDGECIFRTRSHAVGAGRAESTRVPVRIRAGTTLQTTNKTSGHGRQTWEERRKTSPAMGRRHWRVVEEMRDDEKSDSRKKIFKTGIKNYKWHSAGLRSSFLFTGEFSATLCSPCYKLPCPPTFAVLLSAWGAIAHAGTSSNQNTRSGTPPRAVEHDATDQISRRALH